MSAAIDTPPPAGQTAAYVAWLAPHAQAMQRRLGIPASAAIAQSIYETGSGGSWLAQNAKNLYGVIATGTGAGNPFWHGASVERAGRQWRAYASYRDSVMDYGHLFYRVSSYHAALAWLDDPAEFLARIVPIYAPAGDGNPGYLRNVLAIIDGLDLRRFDLPRAQWALDPELTKGLVVA